MESKRQRTDLVEVTPFETLMKKVVSDFHQDGVGNLNPPPCEGKYVRLRLLPDLTQYETFPAGDPRYADTINKGRIRDIALLRAYVKQRDMDRAGYKERLSALKTGGGLVNTEDVTYEEIVLKYEEAIYHRVCQIASAMASYLESHPTLWQSDSNNLILKVPTSMVCSMDQDHGPDEDGIHTRYFNVVLFLEIMVFYMIRDGLIEATEHELHEKEALFLSGNGMEVEGLNLEDIRKRLVEFRADTERRDRFSRVGFFSDDAYSSYRMPFLLRVIPEIEKVDAAKSALTDYGIDDAFVMYLDTLCLEPARRGLHLMSMLSAAKFANLPELSQLLRLSVAHSLVQLAETTDPELSKLTIRQRARHFLGRRQEMVTQVKVVNGKEVKEQAIVDPPINYEEEVKLYARFKLKLPQPRIQT